MSEVARDTVLYHQPGTGRSHSPRRNLPSGRRNSTRLSSQSEKPLELSSLNSPPSTRLSRKRAASVNAESANQALIELSLASASTTSTPTTLNPTREQVCLCQPDPKIPRPRNAFILYRQHYQAQVVQQHPGLANPEISKIIGIQWREQPPEIKSEWKRLAEEEKSRHQRQYPDYRYQPRRAGKVYNSRLVPTSSTDDICPKCHGRYISTPSTPITPFTPSFNFRSDRTLPPFTSGALQERSRAPIQLGMSANRTTIPSQTPLARRPFPISQSGNLQSGSLREHHDEELHMLSPSPDFKRRRMNDDARLRNNYASSPTVYGPSRQRMNRSPMPVSTLAPSYQHDPRDRRNSFSHPPPSATFRQQQAQSYHMGMMEPPPRPLSGGQYPRGPPTGRAQTFDESLRLPPLQTQINDPNRRSSLIASQLHNREIRAKSVEAMIMTIPYINKIKVLSRISPPLAAPDPMSPGPETRGAIIAVEGPDTQLVASVGNFLKAHLEKEGEFLIKTWQCAPAPTTPLTPHAVLASQSSDKQEQEKVDPSDVSLTNKMTHPSSIAVNSAIQEKLDAPFLTYLDTIRAWHQNSREIVKFITTTPSPSQVSQPRQTSTPPPQTDGLVSPQPKKPVALLPNGFSLTTADRFARSIPISDAYAPVDHWQWMATLWRGIVGPDLTVYVDSPLPQNLDHNAGSAAVAAGIEGEGARGGFGAGGDPTPITGGLALGQGQAKDWNQHQGSMVIMAGVDGVDVKRDCSAIIVKCGVGGGIDDRLLRRLGFEVLEIVRGDVGVGLR